MNVISFYQATISSILEKIVECEKKITSMCSHYFNMMIKVFPGKRETGKYNVNVP